MKTLLKIFLILVILIIIAAILVLGYLGFVPGISNLFGSNKPKNLGIHYTEEDLISANQKLGLEYKELPDTNIPEESIKYTGTQEIDKSFTDKEITAIMNAQTWKYYPVENPQVKLNEDGSIELSAIWRKDLFADRSKILGRSEKDTQLVLDKLKFLPVNPPIYLKFNAAIKDNDFITFNVQKAEVGRFSIPVDLINDNKDFITSRAEKRVDDIPGLSVKSAKIVNKRLEFSGTTYKTQATVNE